VINVIAKSAELGEEGIRFSARLVGEIWTFEIKYTEIREITYYLARASHRVKVNNVIVKFKTDKDAIKFIEKIKKNVERYGKKGIIKKLTYIFTEMEKQC